MFCMYNILIMADPIYISIIPLVKYTNRICYKPIFFDVTYTTYIAAKCSIKKRKIQLPQHHPIKKVSWITESTVSQRAANQSLCNKTFIKPHTPWCVLCTYRKSAFYIWMHVYTYRIYVYTRICSVYSNLFT